MASSMKEAGSMAQGGAGQLCGCCEPWQIPRGPHACCSSESADEPATRQKLSCTLWSRGLLHAVYRHQRLHMYEHQENQMAAGTLLLALSCWLGAEAMAITARNPQFQT